MSASGFMSLNQCAGSLKVAYPVTFGEALTRVVIDVVRPLMLRLPGTVIPTDGPGHEAIGAAIQRISDQGSDLRREVEQLRIKGRRVPSKETLFEERMNKALHLCGLDRKAILAIWKKYTTSAIHLPGCAGARVVRGLPADRCDKSCRKAVAEFVTHVELFHEFIRQTALHGGGPRCLNMRC